MGKFIICTFLKFVSKVPVMEDEIRGTSSMHWRDEQHINFLPSNVKVRAHLKDIRVGLHQRIILKWMLKEMCVWGGIWTGFIRVKIRTNEAVCFCVHGLKLVCLKDAENL